MNWQKVEGWFSERDATLYEYIASVMPDGFRMLEVGAYKGRSTLCMIDKCKKAGKKPLIDIVDNFEGDIHIGFNDSYADFMSNLRKDMDYIGNIYIGESPYISSNIPFYYDFIFIDASHDYHSVKADISTWKEFLNEGGMIGGHDYQWASVNKAVKEIFPKIKVFGTCWLIEN